MTFLIAVMSFANFIFYPLVIGTLVAVVIEQIFRAIQDLYTRRHNLAPPLKSKMLYRAGYGFIISGVVLIIHIVKSSGVHTLRSMKQNKSILFLRWDTS